MIKTEVHCERSAVSTSTAPSKTRKQKPTNLVQLEQLELSAEVTQNLLASVAVGAVRLGEDNNAVLVDQSLGLGLSVGHGGGRGRREGAEESLEVRNGGQVGDETEVRGPGLLFYKLEEGGEFKRTFDMTESRAV